MAIAVPAARHVPARRFGVREETSRVSAFLMLALLILGIAGVAVISQSALVPPPRAERTTRVVSLPVGAQPAAKLDALAADKQATGLMSAPEPTDRPTLETAGVPPVAALAPASAPPEASALAANVPARVANTDGVGVVLYTAPRTGGRSPRGLLEGARVTVVEAPGQEWARVRAPNGLDGWVPTRYLAPVQ